MELSGQINSSSINPFSSQLQPQAMEPGGQFSASGTLSQTILPTSQAQSDLSGTLRSFRDSLAFSFQSLNLTLSALSQTMNNVGSKLSSAYAGGIPISPYGPLAQIIPGSPGGLYSGNRSAVYQQFSGAHDLQSLLFADRPYNINPNEYWANLAPDIATRGSSVAIAGAGAAATQIGSSMAATRAASAVGGYLGFGTGAAGMLGKFALGIPFGMVAGTALQFISDPFVRAAVQHNKDVSAYMRMSPRFRSPFSMHEAQFTASQIENLAFQDARNTTRLDSRLTMSGFRDIAMMGLQGNMFQGESPNELVKQISQAAGVVKFLTGVLGSKDVQETMQVVKQLKDMGLNSFRNYGAIQGIGNDAFSYGRSLGIQASSLINTAVNMSSVAFGQYGNPAFVGIQPAMKNIAFTTELEKRGMLTPAEIAAGGGVNAIAGKVLSVQAGLLNNGAIGGAMLYAGWDGKSGFDIEKYKQAINSGGLFGSVGSAAANITHGGIGSIARSIVEKNNIIASAASNGQLDELLELQLAQAFKTMNILPENASLEDKVAVATIQIQNMIPGTDTSTAKAIANKILNPRVQASVDNNAKLSYYQGNLERIRAGRGFGRTITSVGESIENTLNKAHNIYIQKPARMLADVSSDVLDFSYRQELSGGEILLDAKTLKSYDFIRDITKNDRYKEVYDSDSGYSTDKDLARIPAEYGYSTADLTEALERHANRGNLNEALTGGYYTGSKFLSSMKAAFLGKENNVKDNNWLTDVLYSAKQNRMAAFYNDITSGNIMTEGQAQNMLIGIADVGVRDLRQIFKTDSNDPMAVFDSIGKLHSKMNADVQKQAVKNLENVKSRISKQDINEILGDDIIIDGLSKDNALKALTSFKSRGRIQSVAKKLGVSEMEVTAAVASKIGAGEDTDLINAAGSGSWNTYMDISKPFINATQAQLLSGKEGMPEFSLAGVERLQYLKSELNMSPDEIARLGKEFGSKEDLRAFFDALSDIDSGKDKFSKALPPSIANNKNLMAFLEYRRQLASSKTYGIKPRKYGDKDIYLFAEQFKEGLEGDITKQLEDVGIVGLKGSDLNLSNDDAKKIIENKLITGTNEAAKKIAEKATEFNELNNDELAKKLGLKAGQVTDANRYQSIIKAVLSEASGFGREKAIEHSNATLTKKTAIDTAIELGKDGKNVVRVRQISEDEIKAAREMVDKNTEERNKYTNKTNNDYAFPSWDEILKRYTGTPRK
jgi:hypothetical protein